MWWRTKWPTCCEMNHSKRFWAVVESIYPEWKTPRVELKERTTSLPIL
jgi:predicted metal-dependent hydrolase